ncbi:MAG: EAL domain-containing protein [Gammaproteobacteria bacterium]|nr:EAL domain-containing protein [Gammaproteobacteria bacterium]MBU2058669.1 EAL domain-containing protein [Gammaproteobacteria bacterium]MBU2177365.1 EAL domain-containing protein [Gammaproteobacteria bacterium]MBU2246073.1 EAL domain-containing protein [Gammaproteobacteria bacterium]MBU2345377.1 EAL domain-containing protein [Gammaproteobacteria bacterium]
MQINQSAVPAAKILLVDDQASSLVLLRELLQGMATLYFATDGITALELARQQHPELIVLDIEMPGMDGISVCRALKADPVTRDIAIIFITSHIDTEHELSSLSEGGIDFLRKPLHAATSRIRIKNLLDLSRYSRQVEAEKEWLRVTLDSIGDAVIATDLDGKISFMNPIAERMTGWLAKDALFRPIEEVMQLRDAHTLEPHWNPIYFALKEQRVVAMALNCQLISRTGQLFQVEDSAAPIIDNNGQCLGSIVVFHDVSESMALALKMSHLANHDPLTNLPNRVLLYDRIEQAIKRAEQLHHKSALLLIDLDHFKYVNDSIGHNLGDLLIKQTSERLLSICDAGTTLARLGGDEFVLVLPELWSIDEVALFSSQVHSQFQQPFLLENKKYQLAVSIGISIYPDDAQTIEMFMRHADVAMFKAKSEGRNRTSFFSDELEQQIIHRHQLELLLRETLANHQLQVYYQPKLCLQTGQLLGAEALARMQNHQGQWVSPVEFIPLAEETGLIGELGQQVLRQACQECLRWQHQGYQVPVSVNIAAAQFANPQLVKQISSLMAELKMPACLLELEVTESALMLDVSKTKSMLGQLKAAGICISIDDFGTGYSSLSYLKKFQVDVLKIDKSFVHEMLTDKGDMEIVKAVISLAQSMNLQLIAEGIEIEAQKEKLLELGCQMGQGYLFSKPLSAEDFYQYLQRL